MNRPAPPAEGQILTGPLFNEPMRVETVTDTGPGGWTLGLVGGPNASGGSRSALRS